MDADSLLHVCKYITSINDIISLKRTSKVFNDVLTYNYDPIPLYDIELCIKHNKINLILHKINHPEHIALTLYTMIYYDADISDIIQLIQHPNIVINTLYDHDIIANSKYWTHHDINKFCDITDNISFTVHSPFLFFLNIL